MGNRYTSYAGFGLRLDLEIYHQADIVKPTCDCEEQGAGKFCTSCGRERKYTTVKSYSYKKDQFTDWLYNDAAFPKGYRFVMDHDDSLQRYVYVGWFVASSSDYKAQAFYPNEIPSREDITEFVRKMLRFYPELFDAAEGTYRFYTLTEAT